jgi:hypothetical protein
MGRWTKNPDQFQLSTATSYNAPSKLNVTGTVNPVANTPYGDSTLPK